MPKRISDVSLHVYVTPDTLAEVVASVCHALEDQLDSCGVVAWRSTLPVACDDPRHANFDEHWRRWHPGCTPDGHATYEIALSLLGDPAEFTDKDVDAFEKRLAADVQALTPTPVPFSISAHQHTDIDHHPLAEIG